MLALDALDGHLPNASSQQPDTSAPICTSGSGRSVVPVTCGWTCSLASTGAILSSCTYQRLTWTHRRRGAFAAHFEAGVVQDDVDLLAPVHMDTVLILHALMVKQFVAVQRVLAAGEDHGLFDGQAEGGSGREDRVGPCVFGDLDQFDGPAALDLQWNSFRLGHWKETLAWLVRSSRRGSRTIGAGPEIGRPDFLLEAQPVRRTDEEARGRSGNCGCYVSDRTDLRRCRLTPPPLHQPPRSFTCSNRCVFLAAIEKRDMQHLAATPRRASPWLAGAHSGPSVFLRAWQAAQPSSAG